MGIRSFIAINLNNNIKKGLIKIEDSLRNIFKYSKINWVKEENLHITLRFLGEIEEEDIEKIENTLYPLFSKYDSLNLNFHNFGIFPGIKHPRVLWIGSDYEPSFQKLYKEFNMVIEKLGFPEDKPFLPHITLGRIKYMHKRDLNGLKEFINTFSISYKEKVEKIDLMRSVLTSKGPIYTVIRSFYLK